MALDAQKMETLMEKILVIQTAFLGDAVLTLPMLQELRKKFPTARIDVAAIPSTSMVFEHSPSVNDVIIFDKRGKHKFFTGMIKFAGELKNKNYTKIYSPHRSFRTAILVLMTRVRETYGFTNSSLMHIYKNLIEYRPDHHEVQRNLALAGADISDNNWKVIPQLRIPEDVKKNIEDFLSGNNLKNFIVIAPGSIWKTKIYPPEYYSKIIEHFSKKGMNILLAGGKDDVDLCGSLKNNTSGNVISVAGKFSIIETVELLKHADLLICNDSAPTHLGQSADIPVLTLYCSTTAEIGFYPFNEKSSYLSYDSLFCKPCGIHGRTECPIKTFACGYKLTPEAVILKTEELLNDKK